MVNLDIMDIIPAQLSGWPSGLRRQTQGQIPSQNTMGAGVLVSEWRRGFESHSWQYVSFFFFLVICLIKIQSFRGQLEVVFQTLETAFHPSKNREIWFWNSPLHQKFSPYPPWLQSYTLREQRQVTLICLFCFWFSNLHSLWVQSKLFDENTIANVPLTLTSPDYSGYDENRHLITNCWSPRFLLKFVYQERYME